MSKARVVGVDPGLRHLGVGFFEDGVLIRAKLILNPEKKARGPAAWAKYLDAIQPEDISFIQRSDVLVLETMQVYGKSRQGGDPNDLLELNGVDGVLSTLAGPQTQILGPKPREWKGTVPKDVMTERILSWLSLSERDRIQDAGAKTHNIVDGVGLGLWALRRLG